MGNKQQYTGLEIAIIGMSCRFPGANNWMEYWENLCEGTESVHFFTDNELAQQGVTEEVIKSKNYVKARARLENKDLFDSSFFDYRPAEAGLMNPSHRIFHECIWESLEDAGYSSGLDSGSIGVYAGAGDDLNWKIYSHLENKREKVDELTLNYLNNKDYLAALLSYKLNLKGPSFVVNSFCSTSLLAVHLACQSLLFGETKMALAGGISLNTNKQQGYFYREGMIESTDGHCRAFDKDSSGTVSGEGAGIVVLKRLEDAIRDRDHIYAIIKGSAVGNDGNEKVGFTAPSIQGQSNCIKRAQKMSNVEANTITYVETHGTGTALGDPIEIEALNIAFNSHNKHTCAIGSVKTNIGHLDTAAGIAGLIKTALSIKHRLIPPTLHYKSPNPQINFDNGPFYVNTKLQPWGILGGNVLRAGVSSFGIGGTNAHIILEESPRQDFHSKKRQYHLLTVSAKTEDALLRYIEKLQTFLNRNQVVNLEDISYSLNVGRKIFPFRRAVVYDEKENLISLLELEKRRKYSYVVKENINSIVFMFPGQGSQYVNMGKDLYENEPVFRKYMDEGFNIVKNLTGESFDHILYPVSDDKNNIDQTKYTQPLLFLLEYAFARLTMHYGLMPKYVIGHSVGEYVAACISEALSFEDGVRLIVKRAELMSNLPMGMMLSVSISEDDAKIYLNEDIAIAAVNGPEQVVLSGDHTSITALATKLKQLKIPHIRLKTSHAFHSKMQDMILEPFRKEIEAVSFTLAKIPFVSNLTGEFITQKQYSDPEYWLNQLRRTVRFSRGLKTILSKKENFVFLEIGPGNTLSNLLKQQHLNGTSIISDNLIRRANEFDNDQRFLLNKLGVLWQKGVDVDFNKLHQEGRRTRIPLPTYSFEPTKYPAEVDALKQVGTNSYGTDSPRGILINEWFYRVQWKLAGWHQRKKNDYQNKSVLIYSDKCQLAEHLIDSLTEAGVHSVVINIGESYKKINDGLYMVDPCQEISFESLFNDLKSSNIVPCQIFHFWNFNDCHSNDIIESIHSDFYQKTGYESLLNTVKSFTGSFGDSLQMKITFVANGIFNVLGNDVIFPQKATSLAAMKVIAMEFQNIDCRAIDIIDTSKDTILALVKELECGLNEQEIAIRGKNTFIKDFEKIIFEPPKKHSEIRSNGTYLITGANGGMATLFADFLSKEYDANLILVGRGEMNASLMEKMDKRKGKTKYIKVDVSDYEGLLKGIKTAEKDFGKIHGVIHAAGAGDFSGVIIRRKIAGDDKVFSAKIKGTQALFAIFKDKDLDFFVNCSSLSATLTPFGQVAYAAANIYLDTFAEGQFDFPLISIQWPILREIGMAANASAHLTDREKVTLFQNGISPSDVAIILLYALYLKVPALLISMVDIKKELQNHRLSWKDLRYENSVTPMNKKRGRPELSTNYVSPNNETQRILIELMQEFFGLDTVGVKDDFFELGGDSLRAMVLIQRIKKSFNVELSLRIFFQNPTTENMALYIDEIKALLENRNVTTKNSRRI